MVVKATSDISADPVNGTSYTANAALSSGTALGGGYVVYNGTGNSVAVTGLTKLTTYYVRVYDFNGSGGTESYYTTSPASANQLSPRLEIFSKGTSGAGISWALASSWVGGVVPGATDNAHIISPDVLTISSSGKSCFNLTIDTGAKLYTPNTSAQTFQIMGTSLTCNGTLGDNTWNGATPSVCNSLLALEFGGNLTISGTGSIYPYKLRPITLLSNIGVTFNANTEIVYTATSIISDNVGNDNITYTVNSPAKLTVDGNWPMASSTGTNGTANTTIEIKSGAEIKILKAFATPMASGKTCTVKIDGTLTAGTSCSLYSYSGGTSPNDNGGTVNFNVGGTFTTGNLNVTPVTAGIIAPTINVTGTLTVNGTADFSNTSVVGYVGGSGNFVLASGGTINIANSSGLEPAAGPIRTEHQTLNTAANYSYVGTSAQSTGSSLPSTVNNLAVNNAAGVTLSGSTTVNGNIIFTSGLLNPSTYTLTSVGSITGASTTTYVNGPLSKVFAVIGSKTFPVGKGGNYRPVIITATMLENTPSTFSVDQTESAFSGTLPANTTSTLARNWTIAQTGSATYAYDLTLDGTGFTPTATAKILQNNVGTVSSYSTTGTYTASGITGVGSFGLGDYVTPVITGAATATAFTTTYGTVSASQTFSVSGANLMANLVATAPTGFEVASDGATYGPTATFTQSGGSASGTLSVRLKADASVSGSYNTKNIVLSSTSATSVNIVTTASGNAVSAKGLVINGLLGASKPYDGGTTASFTGTAVYSGIVNGDDATILGTPTASFADATAADAKTITVSGYTAPSANYSLTQPTLSGNITKVALTITAENQSVTYGTAAGTVTNAGTYTPTGFVNSENASVIGGSATYSTIYTNTTTAATSSVTITPIVTSLTATNYSFTPANGTITVNKANQTITFGALAGKTVGDANYSLTGSASSGLTVTYVSSNTGAATVAGSTVTIVAAGSTTITASQAGNDNYNAATSVDQGLTVAAAPSSNVTIQGGTTQSATAVFTNPTADVTVTGTNTVVNVDVPKTVNSITVAPNATLDVSSTLTVTTDATFDANANLKLNGANTLVVQGDLTFKSDNSSSFSANLGTSHIAVTGNVSYVKYMDNTHWYFMAFPVPMVVANIVDASTGTPLSASGDLIIKYYDSNLRSTAGATGSNWKTVATSATLEAKKGYIFGINTGNFNVKFPLPSTIVTAGETDGATVPVAAYAGGTADNNGWNLIGQPFLSTYSGAGATGTTGVGLNYLNIPDATGSTYNQTSKGGAMINPFQAYFVQALGAGNISFATSSRQGVKSAVETDSSEQVQINFTSTTGTDKTNLVMDNAQSTAYEIGQDLVKMLGTGTVKPQIYTILGGVNYAYNALPMSSVTNLPIGVYTQTAGTTTISADAALAPSLSKLILRDNSTGLSYDLLAGSYSFEAVAGYSSTTRFSITAQRVATENVIESVNDGMNLISANGKLMLSNNLGTTTIRVFDAIGRLVSNKTTNSSSLEIPLVAKGMYTIQVESGAKSWTKKIVNQ